MSELPNSKIHPGKHTPGPVRVVTNIREFVLYQGDATLLLRIHACTAYHATLNNADLAIAFSFHTQSESGSCAGSSKFKTSGGT